MKKALSLALALVMALSLCACANTSGSSAGSGGSSGGGSPSGGDSPSDGGSGSSDSDTIRLAVVGPMTGADSEYGVGFKNSAAIMANKWNEAGGVLGKKIEIAVFDDKGSPEEAANVAEQIVADESIVAVVGHFTSSCSMAAAPIYQDHGMLEISPCSSHADYTKTGDWIWRVSPLTADEARTVSKFVTNYWKSKKVGILTMNTDWGLEVANLEKQYLKEINPDIEIFEELVVEGNDDYGPVVTNFTSAGVDTVILASTYTISAPFLKQMRTANPDVNAIAHGNCQVTQMTDIVGEDCDNFSCSCSWSPIFTDDATAYYLEKYAELSPNIAPIGDYAQYYDTVGVVLEAIKKAGSADREAVRSALTGLEYTGLSGLLRFDENRNCPRDYGIVYWDTADSNWHQNTEWNT